MQLFCLVVAKPLTLTAVESAPQTDSLKYLDVVDVISMQTSNSLPDGIERRLPRRNFGRSIESASLLVAKSQVA